MIIANEITELEEQRPLRVLRDHKIAIGLSLGHIRGISPSICMHKIMREDYKPIVENQCRLNLTIKKVMRVEVLKHLDAGIIYPISDIKWVSLVYVVLKKRGIIVVKNENNELIQIRPVTGWRVCKDYRKSNRSARKRILFLTLYRPYVGKINGAFTSLFLRWVLRL